ncbi:MAG: helix-turn-helix domain-containing protein [Polynucleobacter sp.]|jgi:transcriptional regulator with XRE-family HTH domain
MGNQAKLPEIRKEAFSKARESLGLSAKDLAGMACLSVRQIQQIENGEMSSFYGAQIKVTAAKKVAALLKLKEEDAFDFGDSVPVKKSDPENVLVQNQSSQTASAAPVEKNTVHVKSTETQLLDTMKERVVLSSTLSSQEKNPQKKLFLLLGIAAALVFSIVNLRPLFFPEPVKQEIVVVEEPAPASPPAEPVAENKPEEKPAVAAFAVAPAAPMAAPAATSECPSADASAVGYKTESPKKAGDMVYLQSKTAQTVCVVDVSGKTQNKTLEPGVGVSVFGKPPLKVLTSGQAQVDMYYQGVKVRLSNTASKTIILEPVEIIQPVAPLDAELR